MSENDYTFDSNGQTLLDQLIAQQQGTTTAQPVATQTKTTPDTTVAQQTMTTPQDLSTMSPQQVNEAVVSNPNLYSQEALDAYARNNNLGAPPTGGVPYSPTGTAQNAQPSLQDIQSMFSKILANNNGSFLDSLGNDNQIAQQTMTTPTNQSTTGTTGEQRTTGETSTTPAADSDEAKYYADLYSKGIDLTKGGQQQGNLNNANDYSLYYSTKNRGTQV